MSFSVNVRDGALYINGKRHDGSNNEDAEVVIVDHGDGKTLNVTQNGSIGTLLFKGNNCTINIDGYVSQVRIDARDAVLTVNGSVSQITGCGGTNKVYIAGSVGMHVG